METIIKFFILLLIVIIIWRLVRMLSTPVFKMLGLYIYYTPTFFLHKLTPRLYEIHLGTTWDYIQMDKISPRIFMKNMSQGMIAMIEDIESGIIHPDSRLVGSIHYFNPKTTKKFGFKNRRMNFFEMLLFILSYIETAAMLSITYGRIMLPRLMNTRIHYAKASDLIKYKTKYIYYYNMFSKSKNKENLFIFSSPDAGQVYSIYYC